MDYFISIGAINYFYFITCRSFSILKRASYYFIPLKFSDIETVLFLYNFYSCSQSIAYFSKYVYPHGKFTVFHI